jgi:hypothetical protein
VAELEAHTRLTFPPVGGPTDRRRLFTLTVDEPVQLGRDPGRCPVGIDDDHTISRLHAVLTWDGEALAVSVRPPTPELPDPPVNPIWFRNAAVAACRVAPGEWFVIGQTRFTLHAAPDPAIVPPSPYDDFNRSLLPDWD